jgi:PAS domain S-box-containing protein
MGMKKILLVENDAVTAYDEAQSLKKFGYEVVISKSGNEAVSLSEDPTISLILMDIDLDDELDGTDIARMILNKRYIPIVFLTSHTEPEYVNKVREITRHGYVIKNSGDFVLQSTIEMAFDLFSMYQQKSDSEQGFRQIYDNTAIALAKISKDFRILNANKAYCELLDYDEHELIGKHIKDITARDDILENLEKQYQLAAGEIDHYRLEKRFIRRNGDMVYGLLDANAIRAVNGEITYFLGSVVDIHERKQLENKISSFNEELKAANRSLEESNSELERVKQQLITKSNQLEEIHKISHIGVWSWDIASEEFEWSTEMFNIFGLQFLTHPLTFSEYNSYFSLDSIEKLSTAFKDSVSFRKPFSLELEIIRPDNSHRYVTMNATPIYDTLDNCIGLRGTMQDITDRYKHEQILRSLEWMNSPEIDTRYYEDILENEYNK